MQTAFKLLIGIGIGALVGISPTIAADIAQLLPNAEQTFVDTNGRPLAAGRVYFYVPNTTILKDTWRDKDKNTLNTNPVVLDAAGRAIIYGDGYYSQKVLDVHGNLIWNQLTQTVAESSSSGGACATTGVDGQVCNSLGGSTSDWGSRVIGAPGATDTIGDTVQIAGGAGNGIGNGGPVTITGGAAGSSADGGEITIIGGVGGTSGSIGGIITITAGSSPGSGDIQGGHVFINGGDSDGVKDGGDVVLTGGNGGASGASGGISITTPNTSTSTVGSITIGTGHPATFSSEDSGRVEITANGKWTAGSGSSGGTIYLGEFAYNWDNLVTGTYWETLGITRLNYWGDVDKKDVLIYGQPYSGVNGEATNRDGGDVVITGGAGTDAAGGPPTYNGNHTGNVILSPGGIQSITVPLDYGNIVFRGAQADQSFAIGSNSSANSFTTLDGILILTNSGATQTVTLPSAPQNGRIARISTTAGIGTFAIAVTGGETVLNAPASLSAGQGIAFIYRASNTSWYRLY
ncbi:MAG TPA: hypothetical protein VJQ25_10960 [Nitrospira sp.]|nr:hypothetical protein [Nitrospira sp.]